jgi:hypothetical protein
MSRTETASTVRRAGEPTTGRSIPTRHPVLALIFVITAVNSCEFA